MQLSKIISEFIVSTSFEDLPKEVVEFTKLCILDYFGSAIAGALEPPVQMIKEFVQVIGGDPQATLVTGGKSSVVNAAIVNGAASHVLELDDIHKASIIHAATVVIPAALAVAEWKKQSGKDLITAVVIGYEVCYRIGETVSPAHYYYWHNTATCGTFGAAAAAAKLLKLNEEQIIHALGNAGTQAAGLWEFIEDGAMTKQLHPGKAAMNGIIGVLLAERGFTGAKKILEGRRGFFEAMSKNYDISKMTNHLGASFKILENSFKIHASCRHTHHAMDLMIDLKKRTNIKPEEIEKISVKTYQVAINITNNNNPQTIYSAKFSLQYCTALAFITGQGGLDQFNTTNLWNQDIRNLMRKVEVVADPVIDQLYPERWGATVIVKLSNGEIVEMKTDFPKGDPENAVTAIELVEKFRKLAINLNEKEREKFIGNVMNLESVKEINGLMQIAETGLKNPISG